MEIKKTLIYLNIAIVLFTWAIAINVYDELPDRIPTHFGFDGKPDRWSDKTPFRFYMIPVIQSVIVAVFIWIIRYPKLFNFPQKDDVKKWPEEKRKPVYEYLSKMVLVFGLITNLLFLSVLYSIIYAAKTKTTNKGFLILIIIIGFSFLPLTAYALAKTDKIVEEIKKTLS